jgi:hypothetical protein
MRSVGEESLRLDKSGVDFTGSRSVPGLFMRAADADKSNTERPTDSVSAASLGRLTEHADEVGRHSEQVLDGSAER